MDGRETNQQNRVETSRNRPRYIQKLDVRVNHLKEIGCGEISSPLLYRTK